MISDDTTILMGGQVGWMRYVYDVYRNIAFEYRETSIEYRDISDE